MAKQWTAFCTKVGELTDETLRKAEIFGDCAALHRKLKKNQEKLDLAFGSLGRLAYRQLKDYDTNLLTYPKEYAATVDQIDALKAERKKLRAEYEAKQAEAHGKTAESAPYTDVPFEESTAVTTEGASEEPPADETVPDALPAPELPEETPSQPE